MGFKRTNVQENNHDDLYEYAPREYIRCRGSNGTVAEEQNRESNPRVRDRKQANFCLLDICMVLGSALPLSNLLTLEYQHN